MTGLRAANYSRHTPGNISCVLRHLMTIFMKVTDAEARDSEDIFSVLGHGSGHLSRVESSQVDPA